MINNKYYAIDCHCHIYPEKIASRAVGGTDAFYGSVSVGSGLVEDMLGEKQTMAERMDRCGKDPSFLKKEIERMQRALSGKRSVIKVKEDN